MPGTKARTKYRFETLAELLDRLGNIAPERVRMTPPVGSATKRDLIHFRGPGQYELIDRVLVAKATGPMRGYLIPELVGLLGNFVYDGDLGVVCGPGAW